MRTGGCGRRWWPRARRRRGTAPPPGARHRAGAGRCPPPDRRWPGPWPAVRPPPHAARAGRGSRPAHGGANGRGVPRRWAAASCRSMPGRSCRFPSARCRREPPPGSGRRRKFLRCPLILRKYKSRSKGQSRVRSRADQGRFKGVIGRALDASPVNRRTGRFRNFRGERGKTAPPRPPRAAEPPPWCSDAGWGDPAGRRSTRPAAVATAQANAMGEVRRRGRPHHTGRRAGERIRPAADRRHAGLTPAPAGPRSM